MATGDLALGQEQGAVSTQKRVINDFSIIVATVNGSGSQSANSVLLKSIFGMGVPVSGKNLFPSNIAGLPTWYTIRASKRGYVGRKKEVDFLVAMNPETAKEDVLTLDPGAVEALARRGKSLLASGILAVSGSFDTGDPVSCIDQDGKEFAKGLVNFSSDTLARIKGLKTIEIQQRLGPQEYEEVIHRDNLVIL